MPTDQEIEDKFWRALRSDRTVMLGTDGGIMPRPMTAQVAHEENAGPIWFFTSTDSSLAAAATGMCEAYFSMISKGHDVFASVSGRLSVSNDRAMIDELWNPFVAAWYEGGKDDPKLVLMRFDAAEAEIWLDEWSLIAGLKMLMGSDPKQDYDGKMAKVTLD